MITYKELTESKHKAYLIYFEESWTALLIEEAKNYNDALSFNVSSEVEINEDIILNLVDINTVMKDVAEDLIYEAISEFIIKNERNINSNPYVYINKLDREGFEAVVHLEVSPLVTIADYKDLDVVQPLNDDEASLKRYEQNLVDALVKESKIIINDDLLEEEMEYSLTENVLREGEDVDVEINHIEEDMEDLEAITKHRISVQTLLYEIASIENITIEPSDVFLTIRNIAKDFQIDVNDVLKQFNQDYINNRSLLEKTSRMLVEYNRDKKLLN